MGTLFDKLANLYGEDLKFLEVNIDDAPKITNLENVKSIPLFLFYDEGVKCDTNVIGFNESGLTDAVESFVSKVALRKVSLVTYVEEEFRVETVIVPPLQQCGVDMSKLVLDDIESSESDINEPKDDENSSENGNNSDYGEDCDIPIEKTITEDMVDSKI
jgi:hypothetical protein